MKISQLIKELQRIKAAEGDLEVTCTGALVPDGYPNKAFPDVFETTVENCIVRSDTEFDGDNTKRVRLFM